MGMLIRFLPYIMGAAFIVVVWIHGNSHGKDTVRAEYALQAEKQREAWAAVADELDKAQKKREVVVKEIIRNVYTETDSSGCADSTALDSLRESLRAGTDRSETN